MNRLDEIAARLRSAQHGPWEVERFGTNDCAIFGPASEWGINSLVAGEVEHDGTADLIVHAPADLSALLGVVREVAALHRPEIGVSNGIACTICRECLKVWPCPTAHVVQALTDGTDR